MPECDHRGQNGRFCSNCGAELDEEFRVRDRVSQVIRRLFRELFSVQAGGSHSNGNKPEGRNQL